MIEKSKVIKKKKKENEKRIHFNRNSQGQLRKMSTKFDRRSNYHELIDDLVDTPTYNSTYSSLPGSLNTIDNQTKKFRERFTTDDRRNQLDAIIKQLSSPIQDELPSPESFNYRTKSTKHTSENLDVIFDSKDMRQILIVFYL